MMLRTFAMWMAASMLVWAGCSESGGSEAESQGAASMEEQSSDNPGGMEKPSGEEGMAAAGKGSGEGSASESGGDTELTGACKDYKNCCDALIAWAEGKSGAGASVNAYKKGCKRIEQMAGQPGAEDACQKALDGMKKAAKAQPDWPEECK